MSTADSFPYIRAEGPPYERGRQHGAACGDLLANYGDVLAAQVNDPSFLTAGGQADPRQTAKREQPLTAGDLCERALRFVPLFEAHAPHVMEEIRGVAEGADISLGHAMLANVRGEVARDQAHPDGCTAFTVTKPATRGNATLLGQNSDQDPNMETLGIVLHVIPDEGPQVLMFTFGGLVGYHGINSAGVAHCANALSAGNWQVGLPHYPFKRMMFDRRSVDECVQLASELTLCSAANYVLADGNGNITDLEIIPDADGVRAVPQSNGTIAHTNHFLHPDFLSREQLLQYIPDSPKRLQRMSEILDDSYGVIDIEGMKTALGDHTLGPDGICRHGSDMKTIASIVADSSERELHVCKGNPCEGVFQTYTFE
jgi:isopenicillin-N N-acyltransferase-like protein